MTPLRDSARRAGALLDRFEVKLALSIAIVASLLPLGWIRELELAFLLFFGLELAARCLALAAAEDARGRPTRTVGALALLAVDLVALASFVPGALWGGPDPRWMRLFRLTRLLLLGAYWAELLRDIHHILIRRERLGQIALMGLAVVVLSFCGSVLLEHLAAQGVDFNEDGVVDASDASFWTRLWWAFRQIQDPGNMLAAPVEAVTVLVSVALTAFGIVLVSFTIGLGTDIVRELMLVSQHRPPGLRAHTILVHATPLVPILLRELLRYYRKIISKPRYVVVGLAEERPDFMREAPELGPIVYRQAGSSDAGLLERADGHLAKRIVILADPATDEPDARTTSVILSTREANPDAWLVAEIWEQSNVAAARAAGGDRTIILPTEKLLALYLASILERPRLEPVLETLLTCGGAEIYTYFYDEPGLESSSRPWATGGRLDLCALAEAGLARHPRVVPIGAILPAHSAYPYGRKGYHLALGSPDAVLEAPHARGLVVLAENFRQVAGFATEIALHGLLPRPASHPAPPPPLVRARPARSVGRVLICGFRPAVVDLCELLLRRAPGVAIELMVEGAAERERVLLTFAEHRVHVESGLAGELGAAGYLVPEGPDQLRYRPASGAGPGGTVQVSVGDWATDVPFVALPGSGLHAADMDLVLLLGRPDPRGDTRTAMAMLKLADLEVRQPGRFAPGHRVLAEVSAPDLARRLETRYRAAVGCGAHSGRVVCTEALKAAFAFQAIVVPGFHGIFATLLGPKGASLCELEPGPGPPGAALREWRFDELSRSLRAQGQTLLGVTLADGDGAPRLVLCPQPGHFGDRFAWSALRAAWVIG